ncbi:Transcription initiation factor IIE subunit beta [Artemisia annua]|uniref:Transcription initiation factor IIE subunit beta n=1 Tax=Artemisia annua TaxID=35608 RepID=A0A2U1L0K9_ARTAN|nr:Transcription initiation factor IIE subunit beta [Artemisia annua]
MEDVDLTSVGGTMVTALEDIFSGASPAYNTVESPACIFSYENFVMNATDPFDENKFNFTKFGQKEHGDTVMLPIILCISDGTIGVWKKHSPICIVHFINLPKYSYDNLGHFRLKGFEDAKPNGLHGLSYGQFLKASGEERVTWKWASSMDKMKKLAESNINLHEVYNVVIYDHFVNKDVFEFLLKNSKVNFDGNEFSCKPAHNVGGKTQLLGLIKGHVDGIAVADLKDAYPTVMQDVQALKAGGWIWLISRLDYKEWFKTVIC